MHKSFVGRGTIDTRVPHHIHACIHMIIYVGEECACTLRNAYYITYLHKHMDNLSCRRGVRMYAKFTYTHIIIYVGEECACTLRDAYYITCIQTYT